METALNDAFWLFVQSLLEGLIRLLVPIVLIAITGYVTTLRAKAKEEIPLATLQRLQTLARIFVTAAEQSGIVDAALATGAAKKAKVLQQLQEAAAREGIGVNFATLDAVIEQAVWETLGWEKRLAPAALVESTTSPFTIDISAN